MHRFQIFEVDKDGTRHDIGKVVLVKTIPQYEGNYCTSHGTIATDFFTLFGFDKYLNHFYFNRDGERDFIITTNYGGGEGYKATWFLKRGT